MNIGKEQSLKQTIFEYEIKYSITLSEMFALFNRLLFESYSFTETEKLFKAIPEKYKSDYYNYLANTFNNDIEENEFVYIGHQFNDKITEIKNIRQFLKKYREG